MSNPKRDSRRKQQTVECEEDRTNSICVIGLQNLGNTCYLNSVLQNLLYLPPFREQLIQTMTRTEYKLVPKKQPDLKTLTFSYPDKKAEPGKLTKELFKLINETAYQESLRTVTSWPVRHLIAGKSGKFSDVTEQDSHELFRFLIDMVKNEEIKRLKAAFFQHFDINGHKTHFKNYPEDRKKLLREYASEFENILVFTGTFIDDTLGGKMISTVECDGCRKILYINEDFLDISLDPVADSKEVYANDSLEFYLRQFFSPKFLVKEYVCNNCNPQLVRKQAKASDANSSSETRSLKDKRKDNNDSIDFDALISTNAVKQFHIKTVGPVLTIHLKRFSQMGYGLHKLSKRVDFPLVLDMSPFCFSDTSIPRDYNNQILYGLRGIVSHSDGIISKDVAYVNIADWNVSAKISCKDNKTVEKRPNTHLYEHVAPTEEWYSIKDSHVSRINHDNVFSSLPYILFYERLPLVTRDRVEEIDKNNNSKHCETRDAAAKIHERLNPSLDQSYIQSDYGEKIGTKDMCVIGLRNLGNTCYLNSVLQNLLYLCSFRDQLFHTMTRTEYKLVPKKHPYLETLTFVYLDKKAEPGKLTKELFKLINETAYQEYPRTVTPRAVRNEIAGKSNEKFSDGSQQDSHELFRFLIDMVKDEEIERLKTAFFDHFDINGHKTNFMQYSKKLLRKYASEFENIFVFTGTFIDEIFGGEMISTVKCDSCGKTLIINEDFLDISLYLSVDSRKVNTNDSLEFYLRQFFSPKFLVKEYVCNNCNSQLFSKQDKASHTSIKSIENKDEKEDNTEGIDPKFTDANKQFHIKTLPPVLIIHLKRFYQSEYGLRKVDKHVEFPLVLDMSPFCVSDTSVLKDCDDKILYGLRGIVDHTGWMVAGHYVAYVNIADWNMPSKIPSKDITKSSIVEDRFKKTPSTTPLMDTASALKNVGNKITLASENNVCPLQLQPTSPLTPHSHLKHVEPTEDWYYISDSYISKTNHNNVFSSQAYILFYERLPLVPRNRVEEIDENNNSKPCETRDAVKSQESSNPSSDQSHMQSADCKGSRTKRLPLVPNVPRDRVEKIDKNCKNISESGTCEKNLASQVHEKPKPSLSQSYIIEKNQSADYEGGLIQSMCVLGLQNLGNVSYFNSVLQNLLYLRPFRDQLAYTMDCTEYTLVPKKYSDLETRTFLNTDKKTEPGKLTEEIFKLIQEATDEKFSRNNVTPKISTSWAVRIEILYRSGNFSNDSQQDSHELFRSLMNMVRDEEIKRLKEAFLKYFNIKDDKTQFKNCSGDRYMRKYASEFENSFMFNGTFIDHTFGGEMISKVNCLVCSNTIDVYEDFLDISLPLTTYIRDNKKSSQEDNIARSNHSQRKIKSDPEIERAVESKESFLEQYLTQFFSSPKLLENYVCNDCNPQLVGKQKKASYTHADSHDDKSQKVDSTGRIYSDTRYFSDAYKQFRIKTLPPVLTIHLQRFYQSKLGLQKVGRNIKFPLVLDMSPFCVSDTSIPKDCNGKILYGLRGIVDHTGRITAGHYAAYVNIADWNDNTKSTTTEERSEGISSTYEPMDTDPPQQNEELPQALESNFTDEWYFISDSSYNETDRSHVLNSQAYILFYERLPFIDSCTLL